MGEIGSREAKNVHIAEKSMESVHFEKKLLCEHPHVKGVEMVYREEIVRLYRVIKDRRDELCEELTSLPEGELYIRIDNNQKRYYHRLPKSGNRKKERRFGIKKQPDLLKSLVRKEYTGIFARQRQ